MSVDNGDPTSLGAILLEMGAISSSQLEKAVEYLERSSIDQQLGNVLVVDKSCTLADVEVALALQEKLRSEDPRDKAAAAIDIATARKHCTHGVRRALIERSNSVAEKVGHPGILFSTAVAVKSDS